MHKYYLIWFKKKKKKKKKIVLSQERYLTDKCFESESMWGIIYIFQVGSGSRGFKLVPDPGVSIDCVLLGVPLLYPWQEAVPYQEPAHQVREAAN